MENKKIVINSSQIENTNLQENKIALELKNFSVYFENEPFLENLNYKFEKGKIHYIVGPSGCGKTVLITHFNGLMTSKHGLIEVFNVPLILKKNKIKNVKYIRSKIGMVFQFAEYQLFKKTILKDIIFGPMNFGVKKEDAIERAKKYIKLVGLDESFLSRDPFGLSGGQKRRVAVAGILAIEPDILIFDEPTAGLDPNGEKDFLEIFKILKKMGKTIIVVTHSMNLAIEVADNLVVINEGKIVKDGDIYDIFSDEELIVKTNLSIPLIYKTIKLLSEKNDDFKKLFELRPRTISELAKNISEIIKQQNTKPQKRTYEKRK
ncbi:MAG: ATP-binding cassette domain-containing protein [Mycoplasmataceae bacterium]|jgi:energy-coupling factor transport system ATP-binding protein|nr:ATP-binding cassette domain-containing protein [Mycoplasmataceae bacterium]